jgi:penicillin-binding protein 1C
MADGFPSRQSITLMAKKKWPWVVAAGSFLLLAGYYFSLPSVLFRDPYSTVLEDRHGNLLGASISGDGQWRFPESPVVPVKFKDAVLLYEDKRFDDHPGVDPVALCRAVIRNFQAGKIVSGGSTISMQLIRLMRKNRPRTFLEKIYEIMLATRLEWSYSKKDILALYASHAPFGGNTVGLDAACWRYFGNAPELMDWSEAALLAVLPNNPSLIHPGRNQSALKSKRDKLLLRLQRSGKMDATTLSLAMAEPVPENPQVLPRIAPHLLDRTMAEGHRGTRLRTTLEESLQQRVSRVVAEHYDRLKGNQIYNAAVLVIDVKSGAVLAYIGNTPTGRDNQDQVDVITARRSTGSILKPILFAAMLNDGKILPKTLLPDIPTSINGFTPKNFSHGFDGAVPANVALIRSLNIPFVHQLKAYRYEKFYSLLRNVGLTTVDRDPDHYGLTLILGGAEGTLWEITGVYASMARTLTNYFEYPGKNRYNKNDFHAPHYDLDSNNKTETPVLENNSWLSAASIWQTFEALEEVYRPGEETGWKNFSGSKRIAWKTGTSFGFRDGWAVGVNPDYAVGVWVGNADGEGRPGLVGSETAAPILFDVFSLLPGNSWFRQPISEMVKVAICPKSGQRAREGCLPYDSTWIATAGLHSEACSFHHLIHVTPDKKYRVNIDCSPVGGVESEYWFVLPPIQEYYFKKRNLSYAVLPPFKSGCSDPFAVASMDIIYPRPYARIYVPRELDGEQSQTIFEVAHRSSNATVYWHLDGNFVASTRKSHHLALAPTAGRHILTIVDDSGLSLERTFTVLSDQ